MNTFLQNLIIINAGIAVVIAALILLRYAFKSKIHTKILCVLWIVIFLRMLIPIPIETNFGVVEGGVVDNAFVQVENYVTNNDANDLAGSETVDMPSETGTENILQSNNNIELTATTKSINIAVIIYALGAAAAALYIIISNAVFNAKIRKKRVEINLSDDDKKIFKDQNIKPLKVYLVEDLPSPCLVGLFRPKILLNAKSAQNKRIRRYSIYHETTHYKNKDNIILGLGLIACIVSWFNPMIWLALSLSKKDREVLCDEHVVKKIGKSEVVDYGKSLLFVAQNSGGTMLSLPSTMTGGKKEMKQRIKNLAGNPKRLIAISILIVIIVVSLIACTGLKNTPEAEARTMFEVQTILAYDMENVPEYSKLFEEARGSSDYFIIYMYKTDIDEDGIDEIYTNTYALDGRYPRTFIECYDLKTETYSTIENTDGWKYEIGNIGDKLYIFATDEQNSDSDAGYRVYYPYIANGQISYKEMDSKLEQSMLEVKANMVSIGASNSENDATIYFRADTIIDISIYDISSDEKLLHSYTQMDKKVIERFVLLFSNGGGDASEVVKQNYKAVLTFDQDGKEKSEEYYFGDSEYYTTIEDGVNVNWRSDGLCNLLNALADGSYSFNND